MSSHFALVLVVACLVALVTFPRSGSAQSACSQAQQEACNEQLNSCIYGYEYNLTTNGSICDCFDPYRTCSIQAGCTDQVLREEYSARCSASSCPESLCFWGAASANGHWIQAVAYLAGSLGTPSASHFMDGLMHYFAPGSDLA